MTSGDELSGRTAIVTGAASGIGHACAQRLAASGAVVVVVDISPTVEAVAGEIGGRAVVADLSDREGVEQVANEVGGAADIVVNNAGLQHVAAVQEFPLDEFDRLLNVMVRAPFQLVRALLPGMYDRRWGRIVNISSVHGIRGSRFKAAYVTAKHALEGLSKVLALEGAAYGVTSNCVRPAYVRTPLVENQIAAQAELNDLSADAVVEQVMLAPAAIKRLIEPDEVAECVRYLCSSAASFVTGSAITIDGGWTAH